MPSGRRECTREARAEGRLQRGTRVGVERAEDGTMMMLMYDYTWSDGDDGARAAASAGAGHGLDAQKKSRRNTRAL